MAEKCVNRLFLLRFVSISDICNDLQRVMLMSKTGGSTKNFEELVSGISIEFGRIFLLYAEDKKKVACTLYPWLPQVSLKVCPSSYINECIG